MDIDINDLARVGVVLDQKSYQLPPEVFTTALNMRSTDGAMETILGWSQIFGTPSVAPSFVFPVETTVAKLWVYLSLTKAYAWDGATHTNITRQTASVDVNYTGSAGEDWNGTLLGGIAILNNGVDVPQYWATPTVATKLADLSNWNASKRAKIIRAFGPFLVGFNITDTGINKSNFVLWSHPADPGSVPASWDPSDATKDAGEFELSGANGGPILDALALGSTMFIYRKSAVHKMNFVGGRKIFDFGESAWLPTTGLMSQRCVAVTGDSKRHVFVTQDDILWHDGNEIHSIVDSRMRRTIFNAIDSATFVTSFIFANPYRNEMYFCYPESGQTQPNRALVMKYSGDLWCLTEMDGVTFRHAAHGSIESPSTETWDSSSGTWDTDSNPWSTQERARVVLAGTDATKLYKFDDGSIRDATTYTCQLAREALAILGRKRDNSWIVDWKQIKMFQRLWPKLSGGVCTIRVGIQDTPSGSTTWITAVSFDPSTDITADCFPISGRALSIEFNWAAGVFGRLEGYKKELEPISEF